MENLNLVKMQGGTTVEMLITAFQNAAPASTQFMAASAITVGDTDALLGYVFHAVHPGEAMECELFARPRGIEEIAKFLMYKLPTWDIPGKAVDLTLFEKAWSIEPQVVGGNLSVEVLAVHALKGSGTSHH